MSYNINGLKTSFRMEQLVYNWDQFINIMCALEQVVYNDVYI